jgi:hypothetical protein
MDLTGLQQDEAIHHLLAEADSLMISDGVQPEYKGKPGNYWEELTLQYDYNKSKYWRKLAFEYIKNNPVKFMKFYLLGIGHSLFNLGTGIYSLYFNLTAQRKAFNLKSEKNLLIAVKKFLTEKNFTEIVLGLFIFLYLAIIYTGFVIGIINSSSINNNSIKYFILIIILYFLIVAGAGGLARFKLPAIPFYIIVSAIGFEHLKKYCEQKINIFRK